MAGKNTNDDEATKDCTVIIVLGMAGSGKTTFVQRMTAHLHAKKNPPYVVNLDPAVHEVPYPANIDIRDTVKYQEVMKHYKLGPNGGIMTALNLFTTKFDQVLGFIEKRSKNCEYVILDTPGQIEVFTWSASGTIITEALASTLPTVIAYVMDTPRSTSPVTFMSNMLYACSILYKTKLPFIVVLNKVDIVDHSFAVKWTKDFESFQTALSEESPAHINNLTSSMSLVLDEFYSDLKMVGFSAMTGTGTDEFLQAVQEARHEYETEYKPDLLKRKEDAQKNFEKCKVSKESENSESDLLVNNIFARADKTGSDEEDGSLSDEMDPEEEAEMKEGDSFQQFLKGQKHSTTNK